MCLTRFCHNLVSFEAYGYAWACHSMVSMTPSLVHGSWMAAGIRGAWWQAHEVLPAKWNHLRVPRNHSPSFHEVWRDPQCHSSPPSQKTSGIYELPQLEIDTEEQSEYGRPFVKEQTYEAKPQLKQLQTVTQGIKDKLEINCTLYVTWGFIF